MRLFLRALFLAILTSMLCVTTWASLQCPLFAVPRDVFTHPWFIATLFDAYWGFTTFFVWVCYQHTSSLGRVTWFVAIMLLGNIAMSAYCLAGLWRFPVGAPPADFFTRRQDRPGWLGPALAALGLVVVLLAFPRG